MSSNLIFRSTRKQGGVAKRLRRGSAKPLYGGSNPPAAFFKFWPGWRNGRRSGLKIRCTERCVWVRIPLPAFLSHSLCCNVSSPFGPALNGGDPL